MELDVAALQEARRKPGPPILRACIHAACQGSVHLFLADFYSEPVRPVRSGTWLPAVEGPYTKEYRPKEVRTGGATDIAVLWRFTTAVKARIQVPRDLGTAYVEPGEHAGRIMVHHVHMAEEPAVLASCHEPEVHLRTIVVVNESASGREVARNRNHVRFCNGGGVERQQAHQESTSHDCEYCYLAYLFFSFAHFLFSFCLNHARLRNACGRGRDHHIRNPRDSDVQGIHYRCTG